MSATVNMGRKVGFLVRLARRLQDWIASTANQSDLQRMGAAEAERVARDVRLANTELRVLAGKWPSSGELLSRRLVELGVDENRLGHSQPEALRDLQRVCTLCINKRRCEHDLASQSSDDAWRGYCPNVDSLVALEGPMRAERKAS